MGKVTMGPQTLIYPMPVLLVGVNIDDKPNFMTVAAHGIPSLTPPMVSVSIRHQRYSIKGIRQNMTFSVNLPPVEMMKEADYCGMVSGAKVDKIEVCRFKVFYGKLNNVPLIEQCPINLECKVVHILNLGSHALIIGQVEETHISDDCLTDGKLDVNKINAFCYTSDPVRQYQPIGKVIAKAYSVGAGLRVKE